MLLGACSIGYANLSLEQTLAELERLGFRYFEGTSDLPWHLYPYVHKQRPWSELKDLLGNSGVQLIAIGGDSDFAVSEAKWPEMETMIRNEIDLAVELGVGLVRIFASHIPEAYVTDEVWERVIKKMRLVAPYAEAKGVKLAIENHFGITNTPLDLLRILENVKSPAIGLNLDAANFVPCHEDPVEATKILVPFTFYSHLKDAVADPKGPFNGFNFVDLGAGIMDIPGVLEPLRQAGYSGYVSIEYEEVEDTSRGLAASVEYLKKAAPYLTP
jgi:sugar phosphate isomerase/epimerase